MIQCRFYDLAGWKATPISDAGKKRFRWGRSLHLLYEKAWLTFSGYQLLIELAARQALLRNDPAQGAKPGATDKRWDWQAPQTRAVAPLGISNL